VGSFVLGDDAGGGEGLNDILLEAFATVREAAWRVMNQKHYKVQIMGGAALHFGNVAEMRTGEGKTLTSLLPAYLNALEGKGVHIVTVNDYLARRDAEHAKSTIWLPFVHPVATHYLLAIVLAFTQSLQFLFSIRSLNRVTATSASRTQR